MEQTRATHSVLLGYLLWIFGFIGAHRFYYGKQVTGVIWFFTLGLFFIGWFIDLFLIPSMEREAERYYVAGPIDYNLTWILLTFLGLFGVHRFYMGKVFTGLLYLCTGGLFFIGILYDLYLGATDSALASEASNPGSIPGGGTISTSSIPTN